MVIHISPPYYMSYDPSHFTMRMLKEAPHDVPCTMQQYDLFICRAVKEVHFLYSISCPGMVLLLVAKSIPDYDVLTNKFHNSITHGTYNRMRGFGMKKGTMKRFYCFIKHQELQWTRSSMHCCSSFSFDTSFPSISIKKECVLCPF